MLRLPTTLKFCCLLASLWLSQLALGQRTPDHETISTAQGLSQGMIYSMLQDKEGFIWVGTKEGLNRYDGYSFKVFTNDPYNPYSISSNNIRTLFEDSKGRIWAGALDAGMNVYDKKSGRFRRIMHQPGNSGSLSGNRILSATLELPDGRIMVAPSGKSINLITLPDNFFESNVPARVVQLDIPANGRPFGIGKDNKGNIWVGCTDRRIYLYDPATNTFDLLCDGKVFTDALTKAGTRLWGSRDVLSMDTFAVVRPFDTTGQIVPGAFTRGRDGQISIGNFGPPPVGIGSSYYYDIQSWKPGMLLKEASGHTFTGALISLQLVMIDRSGIIWSGTSGFGINKYNLAANRFHHFFPDFSVRNIIPAAKDILFLGGWKYDQWATIEGKRVTNPLPGELVANWYLNFLISRTGDYWIWRGHQWTMEHVDRRNTVTGRGVGTGSVTKYDQLGKKLAEYEIKLGGYDDKQPMLEDSKGNIWLCGLSGALVRLNPNTGQITEISVNNDPSRPILPDALSTAFYEDHDGVFWMGSEEGFVRLQFTGNNAEPVIKWYKNDVGTTNSLNYNFVSCIMDDPSDPEYLWICTKGGGLNRMEKATGNFIHLTTRQGLPNDVVYGILPDSAGNIWGSTNKGIFCLLSSRRTGGKWVFRNFTKSDGLQGEEYNTDAYSRLPNGRLAFGGVNGLNIFNPKEVLSTGFQPHVFITNILIGNQPVSPGDGKKSLLKHTIETTSALTLTHDQDILTLEFSSLDFTAPDKNKYRYQLVGIDKDWVESGTRRSATYLHLPSGNYVFKVQGSNSQGEWSQQVAELKITVMPPWWRSWWAYIVYALLVGLAIRTYFIFSVNRAKLRAQLNFEQMEAKRVKELDTVKTQLYTNITHEFRTPLTVIMGMAQQVINKPEEHLKPGMEMIMRNGQQLLNLVNEMLDLSKLETGKMQLHLVHGDVLNFLRYITESFHSLAENQQKQLRFLTEMESLYVAYDPEKIRQIVTNLLSNALKFTPEKGNVYITVSKNEIPNDEPNLTLIIKVKDTGIGIPESQMQSIFERFYQLDNSHTRNAEGTGIGLALTKELVRLMEGEIIVKSPPTGANKGSEFTVILPMVKVPASSEQPIELGTETTWEVKQQMMPAPAFGVPDENQPEGKPTILLVEDNADVVAYTASCLRDYRLAVGQDGREGFDIAKERIPDLIITDVMMPFVDGFELVRRLRQDEHTSHIPIIMLTAKADIESKIEGLQQGADAYLEKPFHREELLVRIKKLLELRKNLHQYYLRKAGIEAPFLPVTTGADVPDQPATEETSLGAVVPDSKIEDEFVRRVREAVEQHISDAGFTIDQLCKLVFMSHSQLHRKLDALTGLSPNKFIRMVRLSKARQLLADPANSIASVALDCGYNDPGYFSRVFKQEFGVTPQEWRVKAK